MKRWLFLITTSLLSLASIGQENDFKGQLGSWNILNVKKELNPKWEVFGEAQLRSLSFYNEYHYYEIKGGAQFDLDSTFSLIAGGGSYNTYSPGDNFNSPIQNREIRTWLEFRMKQPLKRVVFDHRYRAEQRFTSNGYRNRFRYRLAATIPINNQKVKEKTFYITAWNELFLTNRATYFERNRAHIGAGYKFNKSLSINTGYIHQFDYNLTDEIGRDFFMLAFYIEL